MLDITYEVISKIFRTVAAICTAVVVARSTFPNRPNREFRDLLWCFAANSWKRAKKSPRSLARTGLISSPWQRPVSHSRPHSAVSGKTKKTYIHRNPIIWHTMIPSYSQKWNWNSKKAVLTPLRRSRSNHRESWTLWFKRLFREHSTNGGEGETGVYMREEKTLWVMEADRPYGDF
jgi:hypothetical protein